MRHNIAGLLRVASAAFFVACTPALAQMGVPNHGVPVSHGGSVSGVFNSVGPCLAGIPIIGAGVSADPVCGRVPNAGVTQGAAATIRGNPTGALADVQDFTISGLTHKGVPNTANDKILFLDASTNTFVWCTVAECGTSSGVSSVNTQTGAIVQWSPPQGRMSLNTNTPVMTTSYAAQTTAYYTAYNGGKGVPIYNGAAIAMYQICAANTVGACELSVVMGANFTANSNFDGFIGLNSAVVTYCFGPTWNAGAVAGSDTARGTGANSTELEQIDGLWTNKNSMTCRYANANTFTCAVHQCTYVGTMRTGNAGQSNYIFGASASGGTAGSFGIWNMYNRVFVNTRVIDTGASYTYNSSTIRQARASAGNQISFVRGMPDDGVIAAAASQMVTAAISNTAAVGGMSLDSTSTYDPMGSIVFNATAAVNSGMVVITEQYSPGIGWHYISRNESSTSTDVNTFNANSLGHLGASLLQ